MSLSIVVENALRKMLSNVVVDPSAWMGKHRDHHMIVVIGSCRNIFAWRVSEDFSLSCMKNEPLRMETTVKSVAKMRNAALAVCNVHLFFIQGVSVEFNCAHNMRVKFECFWPFYEHPKLLIMAKQWTQAQRPLWPLLQSLPACCL